MPLDVTAFRRAIAQCDDALALTASAGVRDNPRLTLHMHAAAIQAFEFTYELSVKMLKRYLQQSEADPGFVDTLDFQSLIRRGYEIGLLRSEWSVWMRFRARRGATSHTYDEAKAAEVFASIPAFVEEAMFLLSALETRGAAHDD